MDAASAEFHGSRRKTGNGGNGRQLRIGETDMKRKAILGIICFSALVTAVMNRVSTTTVPGQMSFSILWTISGARMTEL